MTRIRQADFFADIPLPEPTQPQFASGLWCCPRCYPKNDLVISLSFGTRGKYRLGRCRCGYWAQFLRRFGDGDPFALSFGEMAL